MSESIFNEADHAAIKTGRILTIRGVKATDLSREDLLVALHHAQETLESERAWSKQVGEMGDTLTATALAIGRRRAYNAPYPR